MPKVTIGIKNQEGDVQIKNIKAILDSGATCDILSEQMFLKS